LLFDGCCDESILLNEWGKYPKQCALITVNEILKLPVFWDGTAEGKFTEGNDNYWQTVKQEINQL